MDYLGRPLKTNFDDDLDIHNHDLDGVREIQAKQINVETDFVCSELKIGNLDVNDEIILLKQKVHRLEHIIDRLLELGISDD